LPVSFWLGSLVTAIRVQRIVALAGIDFGFVWLSSLRCGKLQSFFSAAIAPNTFLREAPLAIAASSSAGHDPADADLSGANSSP
jgi:hypothetical protein